MHNVNHDEQCKVFIEMGKMGSGRALKKSSFIRNGRGYKAKLVLGFFFVGDANLLLYSHRLF